MRTTVLVEALLSLGARPVSAVRAAGPHWIITTCTALLMLGLGYVAGAAPGDLDPSFDADGLVLTHFGRIDDDSPGGRNDTGVSVVVQPDGKLVVAGTSDLNFSSGDFALARYNPNGSLDATFGSGGRVLTDFGGFDFASTLIVQPDGKLVAGGPSFGATGNDVLALARYNQDGSLDASFGSGGRVLMSNLSVPFLGRTALVVEPGGKLVATAISFDEDSVATLVRLNPDGSLDASFGSGGIVTGFDADQEEIFEKELLSLPALVMQPDAKLVAAGGFINIFPDGSVTGAIFLARFNPNGTLDSTFGSDGRVFTEGPFFPGALVRQPDGKLVAVGVSRDDSGVLSLFTLVRYNSDGSLDAGFGSGGRVVTDGVGIEASDLVLDPDGKFVAAGEFFVSGSGSVFAVARFNSDGSLDASFGAGGRVVTDFSQDSAIFRSVPYALAVQPDGKLVAAGTSNVSGDEDFALVRYLVTNERPERPPTCGGHRATMLGTPGNDTLRGTFFGRDVILGLGGNDTIRGLGGTDILCGGSGNDVLIGGDDSDRLYGGPGNDRLFADQGLSAVDGDDALYGGPGRDTLVGADGNDLLSGEGGKDRLFGDRGDDALDGGGDRDRCKDRFGRNTLDNCDSGAGRPPTEPPKDPPPAAPADPCVGRFCPGDSIATAESR